MDFESSIVIIGGGQAGATAAAELRTLGHRGSLVIIGLETHLPYERPPLSKDALRHDGDDVRIEIHSHPFYAANNIGLRLGCAVTYLDTDKRQVGLADGSHMHFDKCLLATGGQARTLHGIPRGTSRVHYIRTRDDAVRLRGELGGASRVAVIGAGFLGLELASTARDAGNEVIVFETRERVLSRALPPVASNWLLARAQHHDITLHLSSKLASITVPDDDAHPFIIRQAGQRPIEADVLVVSVGLTPEITLAYESGLAIDAATGGVLVDHQCKTSHPAIYAAGDCASQYNGILHRMCRLESWQQANHQARVAAAAMLGSTLPGDPYPWFWTDQFGCNVQMLGFDSEDLEYICRGDADATVAKPKFFWLGHKRGVPVHGIAVNSGSELRQMRRLFEQGAACHTDQFADITVPLKSIIKNSLAEN